MSYQGIALPLPYKEIGVMPSDVAFKSFCHEENSLSKRMANKIQRTATKVEN